jgi:hypothetical protein
MPADRYLKVILTIIALELGWMALRDGAPAAQAQGAPTRVVVAGVDMEDTAFLPVAVVGGLRQVPAPLSRQLEPLKVSVDTTVPLRVDAPQPLRVLPIGPIKIESDKPLLVENVPYTPSRRPGE